MNAASSLSRNWANQTEISLNANCFQTENRSGLWLHGLFQWSFLIQRSVHWAHFLLSYGDLFQPTYTLLLFPLICIGWSRPLAIYFNTFEMEENWYFISCFLQYLWDACANLRHHFCVNLRIWVIRVLFPKIIENSSCPLLLDASIHLSSDLSYIFLLKTHTQKYMLIVYIKHYIGTPTNVIVSNNHYDTINLTFL